MMISTYDYLWMDMTLQTFSTQFTERRATWLSNTSHQILFIYTAIPEQF